MAPATVARSPTSTMPILVTGATGNVGRAVVTALVDAGIPVRALVTTPDAARRQLAGASSLVSVVAFDFERPETFEAAFAGSRSLFLMRPPAISHARIMTHALDVAHRSGVTHVAFLSVQGAEQNPLIPHHAIEGHLKAMAKADGQFRWTILRAAFFMQNLSTTHAADIRERSEILVPAGDGRTAFVDAREVGMAAARILSAEGQDAIPNCAYELTGSEALTYDEVAVILSSACGREIRYRRPELLRFYRAMRRRGHTRGFVAVMMALYTTARLGMAAHLSPDLEMLLGRPPNTLAHFAREHVATFAPVEPSGDII